MCDRTDTTKPRTPIDVELYYHLSRIEHIVGKHATATTSLIMRTVADPGIVIVTLLRKLGQDIRGLTNPASSMGLPLVVLDLDSGVLQSAAPDRELV